MKNEVKKNIELKNRFEIKLLSWFLMRIEMYRQIFGFECEFF